MKCLLCNRYKEGLETVTILGLDTSLLQSYYSARLNLSTPSQGSTAQTGSRDADITTPWDTLRKKRPAAAKIADLQGVENFIDLDAKSVQAAGDDTDLRNLFAVYNALRKLRDIAEYTAHEDTVSAAMERWDERFQSGINEIGEFLKTATFKDATVLFGEKSDSVTSRAREDEHSSGYVGGVAHVGSADDPLDGITGSETFTLTLSDGVNTDNIVVDFSQISGDITLNAIVKAANDKIRAITETNSDGETVKRYRTRLTVETEDDVFHRLKVRGFAGESVELSAGASAPSLVIGGTIQNTGLSDVEEGFLTNLTDLGTADPTVGSRTTIAATQAGQTTIAASQDATSDGETETEIAVPPADTRTQAVATDADGNTYVVGTTKGDFGDQFNQADGDDVYLAKYDSAGQRLWTRLIGTSKDSAAYSLAVDGDGNAIVAGQTNENLTPDSVIDSDDSFVTKYGADGEALFTQQVQAAAKDGARGVTVDSNGDIFVTGQVSGAIDANATSAGGSDTYIQKLSGTDGSVLSSHQYGTAGTDNPAGVATASDGNILVLSRENGEAVLRKLDAADPATEIFSINLGSLGAGEVTDIAVDGSEVFVAGYTDNTGFGAGTTAAAHHGGTDGFVTKITDNGTSAAADYTSFVGSSAADRVTSVNAAGGTVYAVGDTAGSVNSEPQVNSRDAFAVKMAGSDGSQTWTHQFGSGLGLASANGVAINPAGDSVLTRLGLPTGKLATREDDKVVNQSSVRAGDYFYISINGGREQKVTIDEDDTMRSLARKVDRLSYRYVDSDVDFGDDGQGLTIEALREARIDIIAGDGTANALKGLGIGPTKIVHEKTGVESDADGSDSDSESQIWGLALDAGLHLRDKKAAEYTITRIDNAMGTIQKIYRKLNPNPLLEGLKENKSHGPAPAYLQARLANYQTALTRLQSGGSGGGGSTAASLLL